MENETKGGSPAQAKAEVVVDEGGPMTVSEFAALLQKKDAPAPAAVAEKPVTEVAEEPAPEAEAGTPAGADKEATEIGSAHV